MGQYRTALTLAIDFQIRSHKNDLFNKVIYNILINIKQGLNRGGILPLPATRGAVVSENGDGGQRSALQRALQQLSNGEGVQRPDLFEQLHPGGLFSELQRCWSINLGNGDRFAKRVVVANLESHIAFLKPVRSTLELTAKEKDDLYRLIVSVCFNTRASQGFDGTDLSARQEWLADVARGKAAVSKSTSGRYLRNAIEQIEEQILRSGYEPIEVDSEEPWPDPPVLPVRKRRAFWLTSAVTAAALVAGGIVYAELRSGGDASASSSKDGKYLALTAPDSYIADVNLGESAVFPPNAVASAPSGLFTQTKMPGEIPSEAHSLPAHEMKAGGYLLGGAAVSVDVRTIGEVQATIHDVRVVNLKRLPVVTGKAFIIQGQGGGNEDITYDLDKPSPIGVTPQTGKAWQATRHSDVTAQKKDTFELLFATNLYAYTFNVAFDYVVNGKSYTQILNSQDGKPLLMRVSADLCPTNRNQVSAAGRAKLGALHYTSINSNVLTDLYSVAPVDPKLYGPNGIACQSAPNNKVGQGS